MINGIPLCQMIDVETFLFQLVFDNYTAAPDPLDASPTASHSRKTPINDFVEDSSNVDLSQELNELRQQLQSMKKQSIMIMDRFRKSSE
jgi:hypothetical protein